MSADVEAGNPGPAWPAPFTGAILVWPFDDAPEPLRALSEHGGDEDWLVYVPAGMASGALFQWVNDPPFWIQSLVSYRVDSHRLEDGALVYIGARS